MEQLKGTVAPREGRVSRNIFVWRHAVPLSVAPREGRVSRNHVCLAGVPERVRRAPRGACE